MKKQWILAAALALCCVLSACGGGKTEPEKDVDLTEFYAALAADYGWTDESMMEPDSEMLAMYYPGLEDVSTKQRLARSPLMSYAVNEYVFMQCEDAAEAETAADILQPHRQSGQRRCVVSRDGRAVEKREGPHQRQLRGAYRLRGASVGDRGGMERAVCGMTLPEPAVGRTAGFMR